MDARVDYVVAYIRRNYRCKLSLADLAGTVNLSRWRLCHLFKLDIGTSPEKFLTQVRLEVARHLLETKFLTVKEVMNQIGMSDGSYFARSFRVRYGAAPTKFQRRCRKDDWNEEGQKEEKEKENGARGVSGPQAVLDDANSVLAVVEGRNNSESWGSTTDGRICARTRRVNDRAEQYSTQSCAPEPYSRSDVVASRRPGALNG
jgi:AraC-like DNA-binding protein